ncbi:MAG: recombination protein NinG [Nitrospira sp.]|nr:recombination protein NinG [Nitrospira sp.]
MKTLRKKIKKPPTIKSLIKKADTVFSEYIRRRDKGICVTCGKKKHWKKMQCGHYYSRGKYGTRWDERNAGCQDVRCNIFLKGNYPSFAEYMYSHFTADELSELKMLSQRTNLNLRELCKSVIEEYTEKLKNLS